MALSSSQHAEIASMLGKTGNVICSAIAKLHLASPDPAAVSFISPDSILFQFPNLTDSSWTDSEVFGALVLISDHTQDTLLFQIYSLTQKSTILFEYELYEDIDYQKLNDTFHCFEMEDCMAGFAFADAKVASVFHSKVQQMKPRAPVLQREKSKKKNGGILPRFRKKKKFSLEDIGDVFHVEHKGHIGVGSDGKFDIRNIPKEWQEIFKKAGIKKSDLKDAETAQEIFRTIQNEEMNAHYRSQVAYKNMDNEQLEEMYTPAQRIQFERYQNELREYQLAQQELETDMTNLTDFYGKTFNLPKNTYPKSNNNINKNNNNNNNAKNNSNNAKNNNKTNNNNNNNNNNAVLTSFRTNNSYNDSYDPSEEVLTHLNDSNLHLDQIGSSTNSKNDMYKSSKTDDSKKSKRALPPVPPPRKNKAGSNNLYNKPSQFEMGRNSKPARSSYSTNNTKTVTESVKLPIKSYIQEEEDIDANDMFLPIEHDDSSFEQNEQIELDVPLPPKEKENNATSSSGLRKTTKSKHFSFLKSLPRKKSSDKNNSANSKSKSNSEERRKSSEKVKIVEKVIEVVKYEKSEQLQAMELQMKKAMEEAERARNEALELAAKNAEITQKLKAQQQEAQQLTELHSVELSQFKQKALELEAAKKHEEEEKRALAAAKEQAEKAQQELAKKAELSEKERLEALKRFEETRKLVKESEAKVIETQKKLKQAEERAKQLPKLPPKIPILPVLPPLQAKKAIPKLPALPNLPVLPKTEMKTVNPMLDHKVDNETATEDFPPSPDNEVKESKETKSSKAEESQTPKVVRPTLAPDILQGIKKGIKLAPVLKPTKHISKASPLAAQIQNQANLVLKGKRDKNGAGLLSVRLQRFSMKNPVAANNLMNSLAEVIKQRRMKMSGQSEQDDGDNDSEWSV